MHNRAFLIAVVVIAILAVVVGVISVAGARVPAYAVKAIVLDKGVVDNWFEIRVLEQTKGKTSLLGDRLIVRALKTTMAYNKSNAKQKVATWLSKVQTNDTVSVLGEYKKTDGTIWSDKIVNRSR